MEELKLRDSGSSISTYMDCPKKYEFKYVMMLDSKSYQPNLVYGSFIHSFIEKMHLGTIPEEIGLEVMSEPSDQEKEYLSKYPQNQEEIRIAYALARAVATEWYKYWSTKNGDLSNNAYRVISAEQEWEYQVNKPEWIHSGKSDAYIEHLTYGNLLYELKTASDFSRDSYKYRLELDKQISSNVIAMNNSVGCKGVLYDIIWKPNLRQKTGRKTMPDETQLEFAQRKLDEYKTGQYFERLMVFKDNSSLSSHMKDLNGQFLAMETSLNTNNFYRNTNSCEKYGSLCPFFSACMEKNPEDFLGNFVKREKKLPELK